jgi:glutamine synthetase
MNDGTLAGQEAGSLVRILTCDLGGLCRVRAVPSSQRDPALVSGRGWVPASLGMSPLGYIVEGEPFGTMGELRLIPDPQARLPIPTIGDQPATELMLGSLVDMSGDHWECCPRAVLAGAEADFERHTGLRVRASFEHEFTLDEQTPSSPLSHDALIRNEPFGSRLVHVLSAAGLEPETWLPEYGRHQWELTLAPTSPGTAADRAVLLREAVRHLAHAHGRRVTFSPMPYPDSVGNGAHVHLSLTDASGRSVMLEDGHLSGTAVAFAAGILDHAGALTALTAPSPVSYMRLQPGMWSATHAYLGEADRGAMIRVCIPFEGGGPKARDQINLEYRPADATANPHIVLAALLRAGLDGIQRSLTTCTRNTGGPDGPPLPSSLSGAMAALAADYAAVDWVPRNLYTTYTAIKSDEITQSAGANQAALIATYSEIY